MIKIMLILYQPSNLGNYKLPTLFLKYLEITLSLTKNIKPLMEYHKHQGFIHSKH